jgi:hypothetical protein
MSEEISDFGTDDAYWHLLALPYPHRRFLESPLVMARGHDDEDADGDESRNTRIDRA